jgi:SsrA-binding protein
VLTGTEVKSLREGRASLVDGYAFIDGGEIWLDAVHIPQYTEGTWNNHAPRRKRKLLMHKAQIIKISHKTKEGGYTLVPLSIYFLNGKAKVEIAVAKGKREYDKRQALRERQDQREAQRAMSTKRHLGE